MQAFEDIHQAVVRRILAPYLLDYSFIQRWSSAYREAHHNTVESLAILAQEDEKTKALYGMDQKVSSHFGRQCLLARRLVEQGVRFVVAVSGGGPGVV